MREPVAVMVNVLGGPPEGTMAMRYPQVLAAFTGVHVHSYDKTPRPGRKVGHVTVTGAELAEVRELATRCAEAFL